MPPYRIASLENIGTNEYQHMKKTILLLILAANLAFATTAIYAQNRKWSAPMKVSCFKGFEAQVKNIGYEKGVNGYEWVGRITNNYGVDVTFDMYLKVGTEDYIVGQFTLKPGASTGAQSHYYKSASTFSSLEVDNVCFPSLGPCTATCFAQCDAGTPNQTCNKEETAKQQKNDEPAAVDWAYMEAEAKAAKKAGSANVINSSPSIGTTTAKNNDPAGKLSSFALSNAVIKQKIVENLKANIIRPFRFERATQTGIPTVFTVSDISVDLSDNDLAIRYTMRTEGGYYLGTVGSRPYWNGYEPGSAQWQLEENIPLDRLSSTLSIDPNHQSYSGYFKNTTNRVLNAYGREQVLSQTFGGASGTARGPGHVYGDNALFFYDVGPNNQNYDNLVALLKQLSGAPASGPSQSTANNPAPQNNTKPVVVSSGNPAQDGIDQYAAKQYEQAIESFKAAIAKNPKDSGSGFNLGISYYNLKRYDEAVAALKQTIAIKPDWAAAYTELGNALDRSKHPDEAIAAFNRSLQLDPNNFATHYGLGNVQLGLDNRAAGIASYKEAVRIQPNFVAGHKLLGTLYRYERLYTESIDSYREALKINPDDLDVNIGLGTTYFIAEQYTESIEVLKKAVEISPQSAKALTYMGRSYLATKQYDLAISALKMAVDIDKSDDFPHSLLGETYCHQKNLPMALKEYNKLVALDSVLRFGLKPSGLPLCTPNPVR